MTINCNKSSIAKLFCFSHLFSLLFILSESRVLRSFYPKKQTVSLLIDLHHDNITGSTKIFLERQVENSKTITFNYFSSTLKITKVSAFDTKWREKLEIGKIVENEEQETISVEISETTEKLPSVIKLYIEFTSKIEYSDVERVGIYRFHEDSDGLATNFKPAHARRVFPCFDDPFFATSFTLSVRIVKVPYMSISRVFSNTELSESDKDKLEFTFKATNPIPVYQLALVITDSSYYHEHELFVSGSYPEEAPRTSINIYVAWGYSRNEYAVDYSVKTTLLKLVIETLRTCEEHFSVKLDLPKLDILTLSMASSVPSLEHPGLILIHNIDFMDEEFHMLLVRALVQQWVGGKLHGETWADSWINEGFAMYITRKILDVFNRNILSNFPNLLAIDLHTYQTEEKPLYDWNYKGTAKLEDMESEYDVETVSRKAANAISLMDLILGGKIMFCLGDIMQGRGDEVLITTHAIIDQLDTCKNHLDTKYVSQNKRFYMYSLMEFWLWIEDIPILQVDFVDNADKFRFDVCILTPLVFGKTPFDAETCKPIMNGLTPVFALSIHDKDLEVIQDGLLVDAFHQSDFYSRDFTKEDHPFFMINPFNHGNFIVQYPDFTYDAFFEWLEGPEINSIMNSSNPLRRYYTFFIVDLVAVATRQLVDSKYLFTLLENHQKIAEIERLVRDDTQTVKIFYKLWDLMDCVSCNVLHQLKEKLQKLIRCYFKNFSHLPKCSSHITLKVLSTCLSWINNESLTFIIKLAARIKENDQFEKCREFL